jgi:hypothetical protein
MKRNGLKIKKIGFSRKGWVKRAIASQTRADGKKAIRNAD